MSEMEEPLVPAEEREGVSEDFKRRVAKWEKEGLFDLIAAKVDEALEQLDTDLVPKNTNKR